jgi:integrating conjugative element protein (TIGR03759 family)
MDAIESTPNTKLHLMLLSNDDLTIQHWANRHQIPRHFIDNQQLTLNQGDLHFDSLDLKKKSTPLLLLSKNGASSVVDLGRF